MVHGKTIATELWKWKRFPTLSSGLMGGYFGVDLDCGGGQMLRVECPECGKTTKVKDEFAGRKGKCPGCGKVMRIPRAQGRSPLRDQEHDVPVVQTFEIKKTILGKYVASYDCPHCKKQLRSEQTEILAGEESCPECGVTFRVTSKAAEEIEAQRADDEERALAAKKQKRDAREADKRFRELADKKEKEAKERTRIQAEKESTKAELVPYPKEQLHAYDIRARKKSQTETKTCPFCGRVHKALGDQVPVLRRAPSRDAVRLSSTRCATAAGFRRK